MIIADLQDGSSVAERVGARCVTVDVSSADSLRNALESAVAQLGGKLDILVNNAGINGADGVSIQDSDDALTSKLFDVNTMGVYFGLKHGPTYMNDGGSIVNTASLAAS